MTKKISMAIALLTGLGLIFLGARFIISPEAGEAGYGIQFAEKGDYSFHFIKGIRDVFSGLLISVLLLTRQTKALALTLIIGAIIPAADMLIVLDKSANGVLHALPHIIAIIICSGVGAILLLSKPSIKTL